MNNATLVVKLPGQQEISVENLDIPFNQLVARCREVVGDPKLTADNFGAVNYFFAVNRSTGTLIDDEMLFMDVFTLRKMGIQHGQVLELCYVPK